MNFSQALDALHGGKRVRHASMPEGQFLYLVEGSEFTVNRPPLNSIFPEGTKIIYKSHIDICYGNGVCGVWSPNNLVADADGWIVAETL